MRKEKVGYQTKNSIMDINDYINRPGFKINPFQYTNADKEIDYLDKYFISPDYFEDVWVEFGRSIYLRCSRCRRLRGGSAPLRRSHSV